MNHKELADTFSNVRGKKFDDTKNRTMLAHLKHGHRSIFFRITEKSEFSHYNFPYNNW